MRYIDNIDNSYPDVCEDLMSLYRDFCSEKQKGNRNCDLYCDIIDTLSSAYTARDYSYLKKDLNCKIEDGGKYTYPIVYFKDDNDRQFPIYINLENSVFPQFAFVPSSNGNAPEAASSQAIYPCLLHQTGDCQSFFIIQ